MPEVAEVAHVCALLRRNVLGLTIKSASLPSDNLVFPALKAAEDSAGTLAGMHDALVGSQVHSVGRHGKYFWMRMFRPDSRLPVVMLMHFGMTGMVKLRGVSSHMIFMENGGDKKVAQEKAKPKLDEVVVETIKLENDQLVSETVEIEKAEKSKGKGKEKKEENEWPPRFTKFELVLENSTQKLDFAFSDPRRLGRVRVLVGEEFGSDEKLLLQKPLSELGPDYSKPIAPIVNSDFVYGDPDPDHHGRPRLEFEEFAKLVLSKKKPIKALLLDQDQFAGVGNWVSDEVLYRARIYPGEVISKKISNPESPVLKRLYEALVYVMEFSVSVEGDVHKFPEDWLMLHRWGKGRKEKKTTPQGHKLDFETVGGRTSCFVKELQKPLKREKEEAEEEEKETGKRRKKVKTETVKTEKVKTEKVKTEKVKTESET